MKSKKLITGTAALLCLAVTSLAGGQNRRSTSAAASEGEMSPAHRYFTDVVLINQDGKEVRLYTDLLKGRTVIMNTFFTTCTSVCPPMTRTIERIQEWLGERLGKDALILSISVDPEVDTPPRLKAFADNFGVKPGWHLLGGKKENVQLALRKIGQFVEARDDHSTILIIGNERTGLWKKAFGLAKPSDLITVVESVLDDSGDAEKK
ncbi:MAG TPA: SCO family protein [Blastocatellia bacterium]|nr:SCO family protein [Blastocatellia bacterium]